MVSPVLLFAAASGCNLVTGVHELERVACEGCASPEVGAAAPSSSGPPPSQGSGSGSDGGGLASAGDGGSPTEGGANSSGSRPASVCSSLGLGVFCDDFESGRIESPARWPTTLAASGGATQVAMGDAASGNYALSLTTPPGGQAGVARRILGVGLLPGPGPGVLRITSALRLDPACAGQASLIRVIRSYSSFVQELTFEVGGDATFVTQATTGNVVSSRRDSAGRAVPRGDWSEIALEAGFATHALTAFIDGASVWSGSISVSSTNPTDLQVAVGLVSSTGSCAARFDDVRIEAR